MKTCVSFAVQYIFCQCLENLSISDTALGEKEREHLSPLFLISSNEFVRKSHVVSFAGFGNKIRSIGTWYMPYLPIFFLFMYMYANAKLPLYIFVKVHVSFYVPVMLHCKVTKEAMIMTKYNQIPHPALKTKWKRITHTN